MKANTVIKFAILILSLAVSFESVYAGVNTRTFRNGVQNLPVSTSGISTIDDAKKEGAIRVGVPTVKTEKVGADINPQELAGAIQNTLGAYLKGSKVEFVPLEAKLASALENEIREKQCDYVLYATVSHKKGGGGFGMFKSIAPVLTAVVPMAGVVGVIAGTVASTAVSTAAGATANVKAKDELTLAVKLQNGSTVALDKQFKAKAKSGGEDIILPLVEQVAQTILDTVAK